MHGTVGALDSADCVAVFGAIRAKIDCSAYDVNARVVLGMRLQRMMIDIVKARNRRHEDGMTPGVAIDLTSEADLDMQDVIDLIWYPNSEDELTQ